MVRKKRSVLESKIMGIWLKTKRVIRQRWKDARAPYEKLSDTDELVAGLKDLIADTEQDQLDKERNGFSGSLDQQIHTDQPTWEIYKTQMGEYFDAEARKVYDLDQKLIEDLTTEERKYMFDHHYQRYRDAMVSFTQEMRIEEYHDPDCPPNIENAKQYLKIAKRTALTSARYFDEALMGYSKHEFVNERRAEIEEFRQVVYHAIEFPNRFRELIKLKSGIDYAKEQGHMDEALLMAVELNNLLDVHSE